jgi:hypothetical protein
MKKVLCIKRAGRKGKGVFSLRNFKKGELILCNDITKLRRYRLEELSELVKTGKISEKDTEHCEYIGRGKYVIDFSIVSYINHSCDPNMHMDFKRLGKQKIIALRNIKNGEEITYDYAIQAVDQIDSKRPWAMKCRCGSKNCRKIYRGDFFKLPKRIQLENLQYIPKWVKVKYKKRLAKLLRN